MGVQRQLPMLKVLTVVYEHGVETVVNTIVETYLPTQLTVKLNRSKHIQSFTLLLSLLKHLHISLQLSNSTRKQCHVNQTHRHTTQHSSVDNTTIVIRHPFEMGDVGQIAHSHWQKQLWLPRIQFTIDYLVKLTNQSTLPQKQISGN